MDKVCVYPFVHAEIDFDGNVSCCCQDFTDFYFFGNVFEQSFDEIWNGKKWNDFRKDIEKKKYSKCRLEMCCGLDDTQFRTNEEINQVKKSKYPKFFSISMDYSCNVRCIFCRDKIQYMDKYENSRILSMIDEYFIPMVKDAEVITLNGAGELFVSKFCREFIKKVSAIYPNIKFDIFTNGLLCDEKNLKKIGLLDKMHQVTISIHATTEKTYNKIIKNSDFNRVVKNIKYMSKLKEEKIIDELALTFVVTSHNYKEIPDFIEFAVENNALPNIWPVRPYNKCRVCKHIEKYDITQKNHPKHQKLLEVLNNPILKKYYSLANEQIKNLIEG